MLKMLIPIHDNRFWLNKLKLKLLKKNSKRKIPKEKSLMKNSGLTKDIRVFICLVLVLPGIC